MNDLAMLLHILQYNSEMILIQKNQKKYTIITNLQHSWFRSSMDGENRFW
jgi:hypothetical protein